MNRTTKRRRRKRQRVIRFPFRRDAFARRRNSLESSRKTFHARIIFSSLPSFSLSLSLLYLQSEILTLMRRTSKPSTKPEIEKCLRKRGWKVGREQLGNATFREFLPLPFRLWQGEAKLRNVEQGGSLIKPMILDL